jgi:hypothetical protein
VLVKVNDTLFPIPDDGVFGVHLAAVLDPEPPRCIARRGPFQLDEQEYTKSLGGRGRCSTARRRVRTAPLAPSHSPARIPYFARGREIALAARTRNVRGRLNGAQRC